MTMPWQTHLLFALSVLVLLFPSLFALPSESILIKTEVKGWAEKFGKELRNLGEAATNNKRLKMKYESSEANWTGKNCLQMVSKLAENISKLLQRKVTAVQNLSNAAEKIYSNYRAVDNPQVDYYNSKRVITDDNLEAMGNMNASSVDGVFKYLKVQNLNQFGTTPVNLSISTVQVPTYIYDKDSHVLNGVQWSKGLTQAFKLNHQRDPSLSWQYFGSSLGFFRIYPGIKWPLNNEDIEQRIDLYDCRVRGWYIQGATSPKNVLILLDSSGSMMGLRMVIARSTVDKILETLSINDYFNIMQFDKEPKFVDECFNRTLIPANLDNRERLSRAIKDIKTANIADFEKALIEAFELFEEVNKINNETSCNKAIMLITDGAPENYEWIFNKYNWKDSPKRCVNVRIFTYLIGREVSDNRQLRWMAGANKGFYTHISTLADVQEHVQSYIKMLSQPLAFSHIKNTMWTPVYMDYIASHEMHKDMRLMTSVAQPVFNKNTSNIPQGPRLLGVVGTDVPIKNIKDLIPKYQLGVNSYSFVITNKSYILFHPDFRPLKGDGKLKPNYNSVDLSEVELTIGINKVKNFQTAMSDHYEGSMSMKVKIHRDFLRVSKRKNHYYFHSIDNSPFSLALVFPDKYGLFIVEPKVNLRKNAKMFEKTDFLLAPWSYCENQQGSNPSEVLASILKELKSGGKNCDRQLLKLLFYDANNTESLHTYWGKNLSSRGIELAFVGTSSGLTRYKKFKEDLTDTEFLTSSRETIECSYYQRAAESRAMFTFSVPIFPYPKDVDVNNTVVTGTTPISLQIKSRNYSVAAVAGFQITYNKFVHLFNRYALNCPDGKNCGLYENLNLTFYIVDDNGFIVASNHMRMVGSFLGFADSSMLAELVRAHVFENVSVIDYQAECEIFKSDEKNSAGTLFNPAKKMIFALFSIFNEIIMFFANWNVFSWFDESNMVHSKPSGDYFQTDAEDYFRKESEYYPPELRNHMRSAFLPSNRQHIVGRKACSQKYILYLANFSAVPYEGMISCQVTTYLSYEEFDSRECNRSYAVHRVKYTNLMLIVASKDCDCDGKEDEHHQLTPKEMMDEEEICQKLKTTGVTKSSYLHLCLRSHEEGSGLSGQAVSIDPLQKLLLSSLWFLAALLLS